MIGESDRDRATPTSEEGPVWELFHENSKFGEILPIPPDDVVARWMVSLTESFDYAGYPKVVLPDLAGFTSTSLFEALTQRRSARAFGPAAMTLSALAAILHLAYGLRDEHAPSGRFLRTVPSAGALYPLELYLLIRRVDGLEAGLYHYNPVAAALTRLPSSDALEPTILAQNESFPSAAVLIFITAAFKRTIYKYGDRGYRFALLEAGHLAQNINLVACALGLASLDVGGFRDRDVDEFLGVDGLYHSCVYIVAAGASTNA